MYKIMLDENDFSSLVSGGVISVKNEGGDLIAEIALQDIGYPYMQGIIEALIIGIETDKPVKFFDIEKTIKDKLSRRVEKYICMHKRTEEN